MNDCTSATHSQQQTVTGIIAFFIRSHSLSFQNCLSVLYLTCFEIVTHDKMFFISSFAFFSHSKYNIALNAAKKVKRIQTNKTCHFVYVLGGMMEGKVTKTEQN